MEPSEPTAASSLNASHKHHPGMPPTPAIVFTPDAARSHKRPFWSLSPHLARVEVAAQRGLWKRFCPLCRAAGPLRVFNKRSKYGLLPYFKYSYRQELNGLQSTALLCGFGFSPAKPLPLGASSTSFRFAFGSPSQAEALRRPTAAVVDHALGGRT